MSKIYKNIDNNKKLLKSTIYELYFEIKKIEFNENLLEKLNDEQLKLHHEKILKYQEEYINIESMVLNNDDLLNVIDERSTELLSTIGKNINSMLIMVKLIEENKQQPKIDVQNINKSLSLLNLNHDRQQQQHQQLIIKNENDDDFKISVKKILNQIVIRPSSSTNPNSSKITNLDYIAGELKNIFIKNEKTMNIFVDELYYKLINEIYLNNFEILSMKFLSQILSIFVKSSNLKYSFKDLLQKKCDGFFFNYFHINDFKNKKNINNFSDFEKYVNKLSNKILFNRRFYLANLSIISHLLRYCLFNQHLIKKYFKFLLIDNIGDHFYLECFIIMISDIGFGPLAGLYKRNDFSLFNEVFNKFSLNKYHNIDKSLREAVSYILECEKRDWNEI